MSESWFDEFINQSELLAAEPVADTEMSRKHGAEVAPSANNIPPAVSLPIRPLRSSRYTKQNLTTLENWVRQNANAPYLKLHDCRMLMLQTGLTKKQIRYFMANVRRRKLSMTLPSAPIPERLPVNDGLEDAASSEVYLQLGATAGSRSSRHVSPDSDGDFVHSGTRNPTASPVHLYERPRFAEFEGSLLDWFVETLPWTLEPHMVDIENFRYSNVDDRTSEWLFAPTDQQRVCESEHHRYEGFTNERKDESTHSRYRTNSMSAGHRQAANRGVEEHELERENERRLQLVIETHAMDTIRASGVTTYPDTKPPRCGTESRASSMSSGQSIHSAGSARSINSYASFGSRKGRRLFARRSPTPPPTGLVSSGLICAYCNQQFTTNYLRDRHVQASHEATKAWFCQSHGLSTHERGLRERTGDCWQRPLRDRTFFRKDMMKQHLKGYHKMPEVQGQLLDLLRGSYPPRMHCDHELCGVSFLEASHGRCCAAIWHRLNSGQI